jgi:hypothetical protein
LETREGRLFLDLVLGALQDAIDRTCGPGRIGGGRVFFLALGVALIGWIGRVPGRILRLAAALPVLVLVQSLLFLPIEHGASMGRSRHVRQGTSTLAYVGIAGFCITKQ